MAALMPGASASFSVVEEAGKLGGRIEESILPDLPSRKKLAAARVQKLVDIALDELLSLQPSKLMKKVDGAQVVSALAGDRPRRRDRFHVPGAAGDGHGHRQPRPQSDIIAESREAELRSALGKLDHRGRAQRISEAIRAEDDLLIGAVLRGRAIVTGIEPAELEGYRAAWQRVRFPAEVDRISRLKSALNDLDRAGRLFRSFVDGIADKSAVLKAEQLESG